MEPALWGLMTALGWGSADFVARFTGRALGHQVALFGMLCVGALSLTFGIWLLGIPLVADASGWWLILLAGTAMMVATLLLYWGLARGPVTIVAPLAGSYPVFNVALALVLGVRPDSVQWLAMGAVMAGVIVVGLSAGSFAEREEYTRAALAKTICIALGAALGFAFTLAATQYATPVYGELQTVWMMRWVSLFACGLVLIWIRQAPRAPARWWPLLFAQGVLDAVAYLALAAGSPGEGNEITAVVASTFSVVTVVLAWLILREAMTWRQWGGVVLIISGVPALSA